MSIEPCNERHHNSRQTGGGERDGEVYTIAQAFAACGRALTPHIRRYYSAVYKARQVLSAIASDTALGIIIRATCTCVQAFSWKGKKIFRVEIPLAFAGKCRTEYTEINKLKRYCTTRAPCSTDIVTAARAETHAHTYAPWWSPMEEHVHFEHAGALQH